MSSAPAKFILTKAETWQFRRAQSVDPRLAEALRRVCEANRAVRACFLLDTRKAEGSDLKLAIALSLDDEAKQMDSTVIQLQEMLREFPETTRNTAIMSAESFEQDYAGAAFYTRSETLAMTLRILVDKASPHKYAAVDLRLRDGTVVENLALDASGSILGRIVGGQNGLDERPLPFKQEDVVAYRLRAGLAARLGMAKWLRLGQRA